MSSKKTIFLTIIIVLLIQMLLAGTGVAYFYYNYEKFSKSESWVSTKTNIKTIKFSDQYSEANIINNKNILYEWNFWFVKNININDKKTWIILWTNDFRYAINIKNLKKNAILDILEKNKILDQYIYEYLDNIEDNIEIELTNFINFAILLNHKVDKNLIFTEIEGKYKLNLERIEEYIEKKEFKKLWEYLTEIEKKSINKKSQLVNNIFIKNNILANDKVQYVLKKLHNDKYYWNIKKVSKIFDLDERLITSTIWVEQIRFLLTSRWYAKSLIKQNTYLTNFSKFSYWLWGVKVPTARKIQEWIKKNDIDIYNKYFVSDIDLTNSQLIDKLENHFGGTLYVWALISNIQKRWNKAWMSLKQKPWIVITLYNMWNPNKKNPHKTPDMWGSVLNINWNKLYFWEVGHILYYYLTYYTNYTKDSNDKKILNSNRETNINNELKIKDLIMQNENKRLEEKILERNKKKLENK